MASAPELVKNTVSAKLASQRRAANRSRARKINRTEQEGKVRFSVLAVCLTVTVVVVVVAMFEALAFLMA